MPTIALNDRQTNVFVAAADQTDFPCDFAPLKDAGEYVGLFARRTRAAVETTLDLDDFTVEGVTVDPPGFVARLNEAAEAGDTYVFYGRLPAYRPRQHVAFTGFSSVVAEDDMAWQVAFIQELRRDLAGGGVGGEGVSQEYVDGLIAGLFCTIAEFRAGVVANKLISPAVAFGGAVPVALVDGANIALNLAAGLNFYVTLNGDRTLSNPTNAKPGQCGLIEVTQGAGGGHTLDPAAEYVTDNGVALLLAEDADDRTLVFYQVLRDGKVFLSVVSRIAAPA